EHPGRQTMGASVFVCARGGTIVTCAATSGYMIEYDNRHLWMKLKSIKSSHFANYREAWDANRLIAQGAIQPILSAVHPLTEIDHIAIAVRDLPAAIDYYRETFGAIVDHREVVESDGVEEALLKVAESYIQLLTPTRDDSPVAKYLEKKGEGLHHVGYRVRDCAEALQAVKDQGGQVIDQQPRPGSRGTTVAFVHPKAAFGTLIELVQE